jgi:hypothetical protein
MELFPIYTHVIPLLLLLLLLLLARLFLWVKTYAESRQYQIYYEQSDNLHFHPFSANDIISFSFIAEQYSIVYMEHIFSIQSSGVGHLG